MDVRGLFRVVMKAVRMHRAFPPKKRRTSLSPHFKITHTVPVMKDGSPHNPTPTMKPSENEKKLRINYGRCTR